MEPDPEDDVWDAEGARYGGRCDGEGGLWDRRDVVGQRMARYDEQAP